MVEGKPGTDAAGVSVDAYVDFVLLREGVASAAVTTQDVVTPFDSAFEGRADRGSR
jgi:hypothetical protein